MTLQKVQREKISQTIKSLTTNGLPPTVASDGNFCFSSFCRIKPVSGSTSATTFSQHGQGLLPAIQSCYRGIAACTNNVKDRRMLVRLTLRVEYLIAAWRYVEAEATYTIDKELVNPVQ